jgi:Zn-dependent M16 (insulinase) family peptidase
MVGTTNKDAAAFDDEVRRFTGGISAAPFLAPDPKDIAKGEFGVALGVYALEKNIPKMYTLLGELLQNVDFSRLDRLNTLLQGVSVNS